MTATTTVAASRRAATRNWMSRTDLDAVTRDLGLLAVRLAAGLMLAGHSAQRLFGWWGGPSFDLVVKGLGQQGYTPARFFAYLLGSSELVGGLLLAVGLLTPSAPPPSSV